MYTLSPTAYVHFSSQLARFHADREIYGDIQRGIYRDVRWFAYRMSSAHWQIEVMLDVKNMDEYQRILLTSDTTKINGHCCLITHSSTDFPVQSIDDPKDFRSQLDDLLKSTYKDFKYVLYTITALINIYIDSTEESLPLERRENENLYDLWKSSPYASSAYAYVYTIITARV